MRVSLLYNPNAGNEGAPHPLPEMLTRHGHDVVSVVDDKHQAEERLLARSCDLVVAAGGDGTVGLAAAILAQRGVPLAILPIGNANNIALTLGIDGNADQTVLSYEHFEKTRHWYQKHDLSHIKDEKERRNAGYKLANDYRAALLGESMKLVEHIVRNDRPFTEIVTADYIMVSPYGARGVSPR